MKKVNQGRPGYLHYKRKFEILRTVIYFGIVAVIFLCGYIATKTRLNMMTVFAVLGCLPSSKALVGVIARFPYHSIEPLRAKEIEAQAEKLTVIYDMIITSRDKVMPVDCIVISENTVFGYTSSQKVDLQYTANHIKNILKENHIEDVSVRLLNQYTAFLTKIEELNSIEKVEQEETKAQEEKIANLILNISM